MYGDHNQLLLLIGHLNLRVGSHLLFIDPIADIVNGQRVPDKNRRDKTHMIISGGNDRNRTVLGKFGGSRTRQGKGENAVGDPVPVGSRLHIFLINMVPEEITGNAGKQIIELYVADGNIDATISNAIIKYNESSPDCYIEISDRYDKDDYMDYSDINSQDSYDTAYINANASLSDELAVDIINGDGPDIIMNASQLAQLNDNDYLVDLSPYVADLDQDKYFTNIIEGAKTGDELYQLPVCFTIEGIQTDPDYAGASGVGFTTEEYEQFLDDELNGSDVIDSGQALYFVKLFNNMSEVFIKNGKIDITGS